MELEGCDHTLANRWCAHSQDAEGHLAIARLLHASRDGHLCWPRQSEIPSEFIQEVDSRDSSVTTPFVRYKGLDYLRRNWRAESALAAHWKRLSSQVIAPTSEPSLDERLLPAQSNAILHSLQHAVTLIVGGPGTGKTFTSARLIEMHLKLSSSIEVALAAPTGKAASNLRRNLSLPIKTQTLHALLHRKTRLSADLILVDECSMIDVELFERLLSSVKRGARLVLVGDPNQLPPVEAGSLFADLVALNHGVVELDQCMRAENQGLIEAARSVCSGLVPGENEWVEKKCVATPIEIAESRMRNWNRMAARVSSNDEWLSLLKEEVLLSLVRKGPYGVVKLNEWCRTKARSAALPILVTRTDYRQELFNGELGILLGDVALFEAEQGGVRELPSCLLPPFELAFALSVHKSQGSEFKRVHFVLSEGSERFGREGVYTAVTRAKQHLVIYGEAKELAQAVASRLSRRSGISL